MRCGEHFELEAALDGGGPSQAPRRAASPAASRPPSQARSTSFSPPPPHSPIAFSGRGWGMLCELLLREGVCLCASHHIIHGRVGRVPATILSTAGLDMREGVCQPPYYPRPGWTCRVGHAVRIRSTYERGWRLVASHPMHAGAPPSPTIYTHGNML